MENGFGNLILQLVVGCGFVQRDNKKWLKCVILQYNHRKMASKIYYFKKWYLNETGIIQRNILQSNQMKITIRICFLPLILFKVFVLL